MSLSNEQRSELEAWTRRQTLSQHFSLRAKIILASERLPSDGAVAKELDVCSATVSKWRRRFVADGIAGLSDAPRSGGPRSVTDEQIAELITMTLETTPRGATHWSTRSMAKKLGLSHSTVGRVWRAFNLGLS